MNIPGSMPSDGGSRSMILLVGAPFTGKSTAAATFPNPVFLDFDHKAPVNATTVPFWNAEFCDKLAPRKNPNHTPNRKDALLNYFRNHVITSNAAARIPYSATLILDSMTALEEAIHRQIQQDGIPIGKGGQPDGFHLWKLKIDYLNDFFAIAQALQQFEPVHARHLDVENRQIGRIFQQGFQRSFAVCVEPGREALGLQRD